MARWVGFDRNKLSRTMIQIGRVALLLLGLAPEVVKGSIRHGANQTGQPGTTENMYCEMTNITGLSDGDGRNQFLVNLIGRVTAKRKLILLTSWRLEQTISSMAPDCRAM